ncbi:hypothetical protein ACH4CE_33350 [Streptomyces gelaticus]|uniref:hypothetical protein n=1 Tax=Streptomyces gelaticus TaxID=285446 RepID=UPI0037937FE3
MSWPGCSSSGGRRSPSIRRCSVPVGLVREEPRGRHRFYHLQPALLAEVSQWLHPFEHYWNQRMNALADLLDEENET